jgi:hypothetical protein
LGRTDHLLAWFREVPCDFTEPGYGKVVLRTVKHNAEAEDVRS